MRKEDAVQAITVGGIAALSSIPSTLLTAASLSTGLLMAGAFGGAFVLFAMAFGPLFGIIFGTSIIALIATATTGLLGLSLMSSCLALYGPYLACFTLALFDNAAREALNYFRRSSSM
jgi:hypothetical protein